MSKRIPIKSDIDLNKNCIYNAVFEISSVDPVSPKVGSYYYNSTKSQLRLFNGHKWVFIGVDSDYIIAEFVKRELIANKVSSIPETITQHVYPNLILTLELLADKQDLLPEPPSVDRLEYYLSADLTWEKSDTTSGYNPYFYYSTEINSIFPEFYSINRYPDRSVSTLEFYPSSGETLLLSYLMDQVIDSDIILSGVWKFAAEIRNLNSVEGFNLEFEPFTYDPITGISTPLFKGSTKLINNEEFGEVILKVPKVLLNVTRSNFIGVNIYSNCTETNVFIELRVGSGSRYYIDLPLPLEHSVLRNLNDDENFQHINATDRVKLDNLSGINTGDIKVATVTGELTGLNSRFYVTEEFTPGSLEIYLNGVIQSNNNDYVENIDGFTLTEYAPFSDEILYVKFKPKI